MNCEHILVDGWNVIHAEPKLKSLLAKDASAAQKALAEILEPIHDMYSTRITIVYDGNGSDVSVVRPNNAVSTFAEVYTPKLRIGGQWPGRFCFPAAKLCCAFGRRHRRRDEGRPLQTPCRCRS